MKSDKLLFYLIIVIIIGLFLYVTYNLIITTCGCIKEGFNSKINETITDIIYSDICGNIGKDAGCTMNNDFIFRNRFLGSVDEKYVKYDDKGNIVLCDMQDTTKLPESSQNCFRDYRIKNDEDWNLYVGSSDISEMQGDTGEINTILKMPKEKKSTIYDKFIKNIVKKFANILSYKNYNSNVNHDKNYVDISINDFAIKYEEEILEIETFIRDNGNEAVKNLLINNTLKPDLSYNDIFNTSTIKGLDTTNTPLTNDDFKGLYKFVGCNLWQMADKRGSGVTDFDTDDTNSKWFIKYVNSDFKEKLHNDIIETESFYLLYNNGPSNDRSDFIYLFKLEITNNNIIIIKKSLDDINSISSNLNFDTTCIDISSSYSDCSKNPIIKKDNFDYFLTNLMDEKNKIGDTEKGDDCNKYCFIKPEHKYYFSSEQKNYILLTKQSWGTDTIKAPSSSINWCENNCPTGLVNGNDISGALGNIPDSVSGDRNEGNTAFWASKFGCPLTGDVPTGQNVNLVPSEYIDSYNFYIGTGNGVDYPRITSMGEFNPANKETCQEGAKKYGTAINSIIETGDPNEIVKGWNEARANGSLIGECPTQCDASVNVFHEGVPYILKTTKACLEDRTLIGCDYTKTYSDYECKKCAPEMNNSLLGAIQGNQGSENQSNYSSSSNDISSTLENPQEQCNENGDWLERLKDRAKTEYYMDDSERIRQIGQEYLTQLCSCMNYKSTCAVSLLEAETIGKYFIQYAKGDTSMSELSEITSEIIKANKFDLFSDMFGKSDVNSYDAIWDLDLSKMN